jgi:hypothetical protein
MKISNSITKLSKLTAHFAYIGGELGKCGVVGFVRKIGFDPGCKRFGHSIERIASLTLSAPSTS